MKRTICGEQCYVTALLQNTRRRPPAMTETQLSRIPSSTFTKEVPSPHKILLSPLAARPRTKVRASVRTRNAAQSRSREPARPGLPPPPRTELLFTSDSDSGSSGLQSLGSLADSPVKGGPTPIPAPAAGPGSIPAPAGYTSPRHAALPQPGQHNLETRAKFAGNLDVTSGERRRPRQEHNFHPDRVKMYQSSGGGGQHPHRPQKVSKYLINKYQQGGMVSQSDWSWSRKN